MERNVCCHKCCTGTLDVSGLPVASMWMILCPVCGNKRCPKASDHELACTGSNDAGQPGSIYRLGVSAGAKQP